MKFQENHGSYSIDEARALLSELQKIQYSLTCGEHEKQKLMRQLAQLKNDILSTRDIGSSPDTSCVHLPQERLCASSQTDVSGEVTTNYESVECGRNIAIL